MKTELKQTLDLKGYGYAETDGKINVTHQGNVDLSSLTTLPEGTSFNNRGNVYLNSLTTLPEGTSFNNQGYVYLSSLTTLPEGTSFNNRGNVNLSSLTTLPEGTSFNNQGYVYLNSLTTLPEGTSFNNQGEVYLRSLTTLPEGINFNNQGEVYLRSLTTNHERTMKTDTPRTDEEIQKCTMVHFITDDNDDGFVVKANFTRQLELELTAVTEQRDRLAEALRELWDNHTLHGAAYELIEQALQSLTTNKL